MLCMKTVAECLAKASELDELALHHVDPVLRAACVGTANGWRSAAIMAREQEAWDEDHSIFS